MRIQSSRTRWKQNFSNILINQPQQPSSDLSTCQTELPAADTTKTSRWVIKRRISCCAVCVRINLNLLLKPESSSTESALIQVQTRHKHLKDIDSSRSDFCNWIKRDNRSFYFVKLKVKFSERLLSGNSIIKLLAYARKFHPLSW